MTPSYLDPETGRRIQVRLAPESTKTVGATPSVRCHICGYMIEGHLIVTHLRDHQIQS